MNFLKTVLITGASRGIGRECVKVFANDGFNVIINYNKSKDEALSLEKELLSKGKSVKAIFADVSKEDDVKKLVDESNKAFGNIDILINNAGISHFGLFQETSLEEWQSVMDVNLKSVFLVTREVLPYMINKKEGHILNISSIWGMVGACCEVIYSTSKAAVIGFTKALSKEVGPSNIKVNCIAPGVIDTDMIGDLSKEDLICLEDQTPLGRIGTPYEVARLARFLAEDTFITGQVISPNGGFVI